MKKTIYVTFYADRASICFANYDEFKSFYEAYPGSKTYAHYLAIDVELDDLKPIIIDDNGNLSTNI